MCRVLKILVAACFMPVILIVGASAYASWSQEWSPGELYEKAGPFTEMVLLGNVALRTGKKIEWDSANMRVKNCSEADQYIHPQFRKGWSV